MARAVIETLPFSELDRLESLWCRLLSHHVRVAGHLEELGPARSPGESWRIWRRQCAEWAREPAARILVARDGDALLGYAVVRVVHGPGSWRWGDDVGVLETLVVDDEARGAGVGGSLLAAVHAHLSALQVNIMKIGVISGNEGALRFYRREGAVDFIQTLIMPVRAESD